MTEHICNEQALETLRQPKSEMYMGMARELNMPVFTHGVAEALTPEDITGTIKIIDGKSTFVTA